MEFLKCKAVIALTIMILGVSYISASDDVAGVSHAQDDGVNVSLNA